MGGSSLFGKHVDGVLRDFPFSVSVRAYYLTFILYLILLPVSFYVSYERGDSPDAYRNFSLLMALFAPVTFVVYSVAITGFMKLGLECKSRLLGYASAMAVLSSMIAMGFEIVGELLFWMGSSHTNTFYMASYLVGAIVSGITSLAFGVGVWRARDNKLFKTVGGLNVLVGIMSLTVFLFVIAVIASLPLILLEARLLSKEDKKVLASASHEKAH
ncbi:MAG: hypothetical protein GF416_01245 [Candidatus Altiarchaeales archaeon]|nr:hypothetical protein [Candidatus Altiarchaeales archaeon]MBD3415741.1 hypothetical protein [Candidatus Altiarchaeales archaeon]